MVRPYLERSKLRSKAYKAGVRSQFEKHLKDWLRLPLDEITKAMVAERHRSLSSIPNTANNTLKYFRTIWDHARRTHDLPESPTISIEWFEERLEGVIIDDFQAWRREVDDLYNPIHRVYYELLLFTGLGKSEALALE